MKRRPGNIIAAALLACGLSVAGSMGAVPAQAAKRGNPASVEFYQDAVRYLKKGDVNAAVIQLKNSLQKDPDNIESRRLLGDIYLRTGNPAGAEKELKAAYRRSNGTDKLLMVGVARAYLMQGKYEAVLNELADDASAPDIRAQVLLARGQAYLGLGKLVDAGKSFAEAEKLAPDRPGIKVAAAQVLINQGKPDQADAKIDEALAQKPDLPEGLVLKGEIRRLAGAYEEAVRYFDRAVKLSPFNLTARLGRAAALISLNKEADAAADLKVVFERVPRHPLASHLQALIRFRAKDFEGALESLQQAGKALDDHLPSLFLRGAASYATNQFEQAEKALQRYMAEVPDNAPVRTLLAATELRNNQPARSIETLKPLLGTKNESPQVLALLGTAYMRLGKFAESSEYFQKAAQLAPNMASIQTQLAVSHLAQGATEKAVSNLETAIEIDPDSRQASVLLALMRLREGKFDKALDVARQLSVKMPENPLPKNLMGAAYLGKKQIAEARRNFEAALKINPRFHPARMNLARLDMSEKNFASARANLQQILSEQKNHTGAMLALAELAAAENRPDEVVSWLRAADAANPKDTTAYARLIRFYQSRRDMERALVVAQELDARFPKDPRVIETLGRTELAAGKAQDAATSFGRLVDLAPKSTQARLLLAQALSSAGDIPGARRSLRTAIETDPRNVPAYMALGRLELRAGNEPAALRVADTLTQKMPGQGAGRILAGDIFMEVKKYDRALAAYQTAVKTDDSAAAVLRRFGARGRLDQTDRGLAELQKWVDRKNDRDVRNVLATSYIAAKRIDDAMREERRLLQAEPDNPVLLNNLAWLYDQKGDPRAVETAEHALKLAPDAAAIKDTLGWILSRRGDGTRAVTLLRQAYDAAPHLGDIAYHYAATLKRLGRQDEARTVLQKVFRDKVQFSESKNAQKLLDEIGG